MDILKPSIKDYEDWSVAYRKKYSFQIVMYKKFTDSVYV